MSSVQQTVPRVPRIRATILVSDKDPAVATSLVEYADGRFGICRGGQRIGEKWPAERLLPCLDEYRRMTRLAKLSNEEALAPTSESGGPAAVAPSSGGYAIGHRKS
jgi:hypothetical protein